MIAFSFLYIFVQIAIILNPPKWTLSLATAGLDYKFSDKIQLKIIILICRRTFNKWWCEHDNNRRRGASRRSQFHLRRLPRRDSSAHDLPRVWAGHGAQRDFLWYLCTHYFSFGKRWWVTSLYTFIWTQFFLNVLSSKFEKKHHSACFYLKFHKLNDHQLYNVGLTRFCLVYCCWQVALKA